MAKKKSSSFVIQAAILAIAGFLVRIIGLLYGVPLTRIIGDLGNGYYSTAYNFYVIILMVASYGIPTAVSKIVSAKLVLKEYRNAYRIFKCALLYVIVVGGIAAAVTFIFAPGFVDVKEAVPALRVLAPTIFISGLLSVFRGYMQAHGTMIPTSVSQIVEQIMNAIVSVTAAYILTRPFVGAADETALPMHGAAGAATGTGIGVLFGLLVVFIFYLKNRREMREKCRLDTKPVESYGKIFRMLLFMVTPVILSTCIYNVSTIIDMHIFYWLMKWKHMAQSTYVSLYGIFSRKYNVLINVPIALATAVSSAMIPGISGSYEVGDKAGAGRRIDQALRFTMMISIPAAVGMAVLAKPIMDLLFPGSLPVAHHLLTAGAVSVLLYGMSTVLNGALQGIGKVNVPMINAAISLGIHVVFLVVILSCFDSQLYGILSATIVYSFSMCVLNGHAVKKYLGYRQEYRQTFGYPLLAATVMGVVTFSTYRLCYMALPSNLLAITVSVLFSVTVYFIVLMKIGGFTEEQLLAFPKGALLVKIAKKCKLIR